MQLKLNIPPEVYKKLYEEAQKRDMKVEQLIEAMVTVIVKDNFVDAVMDDKQ